MAQGGLGIGDKVEWPLLLPRTKQSIRKLPRNTIRSHPLSVPVTFSSYFCIN